MRRLPIFFFVDVSESMVGENLHRLEEGIKSIISTLRKDPYALETAFLSVIVFAGKAKTLTPLTDIITFQPPDLPVGGGTALGSALEHLMDDLDRTLTKSTPEQKGDWKPIIFLLTDGHPTDNPTKAVARWYKNYRSRINLVAVSIGGNADHTLLKKLTETVLIFDDTAPEAFTKFIKWISQSIQSQSRSVSSGKDAVVCLAKEDTGLLRPYNENTGASSPTGVDDRFAVFVGKCCKTKLPYVMKYEQRSVGVETTDPKIFNLFQSKIYSLCSVTPVKASYFELSDGVASGQSVKSGQLSGHPTCPHCGADYAMAVCACGGIHCITGPGKHTCPWCGKVGSYEFSADGKVGEGFDIGRGRG